VCCSVFLSLAGCRAFDGYFPDPSLGRLPFLFACLFYQMNNLLSVVLILSCINGYLAQEAYYVVENSYYSPSSCDPKYLITSDFVPANLCYGQDVDGGYRTKFFANGTHIVGGGYDSPLCEDSSRTAHFTYDIDYCYTNPGGHSSLYTTSKVIEPYTKIKNVAIEQNFGDFHCTKPSDTVLYYFPSPCYHVDVSWYDDCVDEKTIEETNCDSFDCTGVCNTTVAALPTPCLFNPTLSSSIIQKCLIFVK